MSKRKHHHEEEEHENHERWLVTYADMVTLLMVFFIVMFAMSTVDEKKYLALKNGLAAGFANSASVLPGSKSLLSNTGTAPVSQVAPDRRLTALNDLTTGAQDTPQNSQAAQKDMQAMRESQRLRKAQTQVMDSLKSKGLADDVQTTIDDRGLVISLVSKHVVFESDSAVLTARGAAVVDALAPALQALPEDLQIAGHTNQVAVRPANYATDWDLSAARAITVLRRLNEQLGIPDTRLSLSAYGHTQPLEDPSLPGSQAINKRVDIVVLSGSDAESRQLVAQFASDQASAAATDSTSTGTSTDTSTGTSNGTGTDTSTASGTGTTGAGTTGTSSTTGGAGTTGAGPTAGTTTTTGRAVPRHPTTPRAGLTGPPARHHERSRP